MSGLSLNAGCALHGLYCKWLPVPMRDVARQAGLRFTSAEKAVRELEVAGLVHVTPADTGALVRLTVRGAELALAERNARALARRGAA